MRRIFLSIIRVIMCCSILVVSAPRKPNCLKRSREVEPAGALLLSADNPSDIRYTKAVLARGGVAGLRTETVYGLAADAKNPEAVKKIFAAKGRPADHPLIVHIDSFEKVAEWADDVSPYAEKLAAAFWPGPLTMCFKKQSHVLSVVTGGLSTVCLRVPNDPVFLRLLRELGTGFAAPSANKYKQLSPTTAAHVMSGLCYDIDVVLDGGPCGRGVESTIVDLTGPVPCILRPGPITKEMIEEVLGIEIEAPLVHCGKVPGNVEEHYQPLTPASLMRLSSMQAHIEDPMNAHKTFAVVHYSSVYYKDGRVALLRLPSTKDDYERELYRMLHEADGLNVDEILIERPPEGPDWVAVKDRLRRATAVKASRRKESVCD